MLYDLRKDADNLVTGVVVCGHGRIATGIIDALQVILGECSNIAGIGLEEADNVEEWGEKLKETVKEFPQGCIVLFDLLGGTPCNQYLMKFVVETEGTSIYAVAGINLGMLLEVVTQRESVTLEELCQIATSSGKNAIVDVGERFKR